MNSARGLHGKKGELRGEMSPTVVFLLSDKRSGSTMFQCELCKHPDIRHVEYSPHTYFETHHWLKAAVLLKEDCSLFSGGRLYDGYGSRRNAQTYLLDCIQKNVPEFVVPDDERELVFSGWEALCEKYARPVFFEKSPQFLAHRACLELMLEWIGQTGYRVKVIGLVRHPLSVLYSAHELFHTDPTKRQYGWAEIHRNLMDFKEQLTENQFMLCRYEDIIQEPVASFDRICRFLGVEPDATIGAAVHGGSINKWETDPFFTVQLDDEVKRMAHQFGYGDDELHNPDKPVPTLGYRVRRKLEGVFKRSLARLRYRVLTPFRLRLEQNRRERG